MTERKDFKRVVRARVQRTGESYSSALRNVRNARLAGSAATLPAGPTRGALPVPVQITRTIPDIRSTDIDKTIRFYTEFLGFEVVRDGDAVTGFVSATHSGVEVTFNHGAGALPPGFVVEVATVEEVRVLFERAVAASVRMIDDLSADGQQFSMLDPSGRCVTIASADLRPAHRPARPGAVETIVGAPASVTTYDLDATRSFYVDLLGFELHWERGGRMSLGTRAGHLDLIVSSAEAGGLSNGGATLDVQVGTLDRVDALHHASTGTWIVLHGPVDLEKVRIRSFGVLDPSGTAINVYAVLEPMR